MPSSDDCVIRLLPRVHEKPLDEGQAVFNAASPNIKALHTEPKPTVRQRPLGQACRPLVTDHSRKLKIRFVIIGLLPGSAGEQQRHSKAKAPAVRAIIR